MYIHGSFINRHGDKVTVEIVTRADRSSDLEIGTEEAGLWFCAEEAVTTEAEVNDTFDVLLRHSATVRLLARSFVPDFFCASPLDAVVNIRRGGALLFAGFIEPQAYSQPYNDALDEVELSCIDALSALQYARYKDVGAAGVLYLDVKAEATQRTFIDIIAELIGGVAAGLDLSGTSAPRLLYDGSRAMDGTEAARYSIFSRLAIPELLFLGDTEDDVWGKDEVLEELLRYLDLHIVQHGTDFYVFSWQTLRAEPEAASRSIGWRDLLGAGGDVATAATRHDITPAMAADTDATISVGEVYNQLLLTCSTTGADTLVESPLDGDSMTSPYTRRQKYMTEYISAGEGVTAITAYRDMLRGRNTGYDGARKAEWFVQVMDNAGWTFYDYDGGKADAMEKWAADGTNQHGLPRQLGSGGVAALLSIGKRDADLTGKNNAPNNPSMSTCLVIGTRQLRKADAATEEEAADTIAALLPHYTPMAEYMGNVAGGAFSPSDEVITNYIVITGKVTLVPIVEPPLWSELQVGIGGSEGSTITDDWIRKWWHMTVNGDYLARQYWKATDPADEPVTDPIGEFGFYPCTDKCQGSKAYEFTYSAIGEGTDTVSKVAVLCCMLVIGGKCLVETGTDGQVSDFEWRAYKPLAECADEDEYYRQSFTIGFDPKIGDKLVGTEFDVQDNNFDLGIDLKGTCIPIRKSDGLNGDVHFMILGPVNSLWNVITRRHPTFFRHTGWTENSVPLLGHISSIIVKDLEIRLCSDATGGTTADNDIVYMSDVRGGFVNRKDDIEFRVHSALTAAECADMGVANSVMLSVPVDTAGGTGALSVRDTVGGREGKPEQLYVDAYYDECHEPRLLLEQAVEDTGGAVGALDRYRHRALGKDFYVLGVSRDLAEGTARLKLKELWT